jgi:polar amino acid transport system substrate-binding protein
MIAQLFAWVVLVFAALPAAAHAERYNCATFAIPSKSHPGSDGGPTRFSVEVVGAVFSALGKSLDIQIYPLSRALALAKQKQADCVFAIVRSAEREQFLVYSNVELVSHSMYLYARASESSRYGTDLQKLAGLRIGTVRQTYNGNKFEAVRATLVIDEASDFEQNFLKLLFGRVDLVISSAHIARSILALPSMRDKADDLVRLEPVVEHVGTFVAFGKTAGALAFRDRFDAELKKFMASPAYAELRQKYQME